MIRRLRVSRFRSLGKDVVLEFDRLTVLVGPNGAGKSNTLDALVFLADCMQLGLEGAITKRGGISAVRHTAHGRPYDVVIRVECTTDAGAAEYEIVLTGDRVEDYRVKREHARCGSAEFTVEGGTWRSGPPELHPRVEPTSLALPLVAGDDRFAMLASTLRSVASYSIFPDALRAPEKYDPRRPMDRHGRNWVSVLKDQSEDSWKPDLITVLNKLTGDVTDVRFQHVAGFLVLEFQHDVGHAPGANRKKWFAAAQESDGTLRVAGMLTALLQRPRPALVAIEEPELTVHPGAIELLSEYIREGSLEGQIVLTTHSPDFLTLLPDDEVRVVERREGDTRISRLDEAQREVVNRGLFSLGDIMRAEGLRPFQPELPFRD